MALAQRCHLSSLALETELSLKVLRLISIELALKAYIFVRLTLPQEAVAVLLLVCKFILPTQEKPNLFV